jgi:hypothetical protein
MATFYKYAERSAESQVNWAEIGKNMTDMLRQEVAVREEKKAAIDEATRRYAEQLSNAPQGEHVGAREEALRFADQASKYMLQQERLLKSGLLDPKDYMVARQNLVDGTKRAFGAMKAFQEQYGELMQRAQKDESSALELDNLEEVQGYGNFSQSGFFIDAPTGKVNVALKEEQIIDGQKVIGLKDGSSRGMEYIDGSIYGRIDKFKPREALVSIADTLGKEIRASLDPSTLSKLGSITSIEDLRLRTDIDPEDKTVLFEFYSSIKQSVNSIMENPLQKASLLRDTLGYRTTLDAAAAAKDPKLILKVIDPATGRGEYQFSDAQNKEAEKWMTGQLLGMIDRKQTIDATAFTPQPRAQTDAEINRDERRREAENFGRNLGRALKSPDLKERDNAIRYLGQKAGRQVDIENGILMVYDLDGKGKSEFNLNDNPDKIASALISAFGVDLPEDTILKFSKEEYKGNRTNTSGSVRAIVSAPPVSDVKIIVPTDAFTQESTESAAVLQEALGSDFIVEDVTPSEWDTGNIVKITAPNGKTRTINNTELDDKAAATMAAEIQAWAKANNQRPEPQQQGGAAGQQSGTGNIGAGGAAAGNLNATNRKPK